LCPQLEKKTDFNIAEKTRLRIIIRGAVQGVGFRPFVFRMAQTTGLTGWIANGNQGVHIEVEGPTPSLKQFLARIQTERPAHAHIQSIESTFLDTKGYGNFEIRTSLTGGSKSALLLPDIATCPACLAEVFDPKDRRYLYPFTNCTHCGPRFSIIAALPYDRKNTTMKTFAMCHACRAEYADPGNRRYHAQPNACPDCGPHVAFWDRDGSRLAEKNQAVAAASDAIRDGLIVAVKGLGGCHLMVDAGNKQAVAELRRRKRRGDKPFAVMFPAVEDVKAYCEISAADTQALISPATPIVLLPQKRSRNGNRQLEHVAPGNPNVGAILPYTPLHHILMRMLRVPVIATSGNLADEPICIDEYEALERLQGIADRFLVHNRPILRHVDDSIVRVLAGREVVLRRARGLAPLPITIPQASAKILAVGAHLKNSVALSLDKNVFISQHIGDLETSEARTAFEDVISSFAALYETTPDWLACDAHPDYFSTAYANRAERPTIHVQHHYAHVLSCMAENELEPPLLGVAWDGTGYGMDGTIWGGEFFDIQHKAYSRAAHLRPFLLAGGQKAVLEPRRVAVSLLHQIFNDLSEIDDLAPLSTLPDRSLSILLAMLRKQVNTPATSSVGRLFDAVASILDIRQSVDFEGQAAMALEFAIGDCSTVAAYPMPLSRQAGELPLILDWRPMLKHIIADQKAGIPRAEIAAKFHNTLVAGLISVAKACGQQRVILSGGCFQNRYLIEKSVNGLLEVGMQPYWHQRVPPNDGGIALGQIIAAQREIENEQAT
jgi:hydrogenase maturation protein HypF